MKESLLSNHLQQELILILHDNYKRAKEDYQLTIETILWCLEYNMSFETFSIYCESAPCTFYNELLSIDQSVKVHRASIIKESKKYLNNLCSSVFKFLERLSHHYQLHKNFDLDALEELFTEVPLKQKSIFLETLNKPEVLSSIAEQIAKHSYHTRSKEDGAGSIYCSRLP